jgi:hypothetical protein
VLHLVAEELYSKGLSPGAWEDVYEPASNGYLPPLLGSLDALVTSQRERFHEAVDARLVAGSDTHYVRSLMGRRHALRECTGGHADEPSIGEHGERACALTDEMRRRLEPRAEANATARKQRDSSRIEVPGDGLGNVTRLLVLGEKANERAGEGFVQGGENERQRGFRDTRWRRKVIDERAKSLARGELGDET